MHQIHDHHPQHQKRERGQEEGKYGERDVMEKGRDRGKHESRKAEYSQAHIEEHESRKAVYSQAHIEGIRQSLAARETPTCWLARERSS